MDIKEDVENDLQEGITDPLMRVEKNLADGGSSRGGNQWMVYLSTFVAVCGSYEFGCCIGYSSPTQSAIREDLSLTLAEALRVSCAFCVAGWLAIYFSKGALSLDIGRLATGYGMGAFSYVVPVFIAEIAPKNLRGRLTAINQLMIISGVSISFIIGVLVSWRALALIGLVPCAVTIFGLFFIPESPRWLAKTGRQREFEMALQKLRGKDADISHEAAEIQDYILTLDRLPKAKLLDLFQRRYLRSVMIAVGLMVFQQLGGINGVCFYVSNIFEQAGFSSSVGTITYAILQVVVTGIGAAVMDKAWKKASNFGKLVSASGVVLGCLLTAVSFFLKVHELALTATPILAVTGILFYIGSFSIGMGAVPWVVMSEIFPINIKGQAGSLATLVNWFGAWLCSYTFNYLMSWSSYGTFILYAAINALAILFVTLMSPLLRAIAGVHKSTPFPVGFTNCSESYGSEVSEYLAFRYPELVRYNRLINRDLESNM
ncbi:sugar transporter ERD6-like 7 [Prunus yedoensis var. nudiflora]|uniref:Sugar transporter ERD6-like 7 n=1 Tax=Prunus yedoensis var. nudiflora TaxID=2094558 RepID=A0A314U6T0_PRUYE|nr:sugar transporter ERD6-like 7 [Prunus yedoensis var. nudiflora]